MQVINGKSKKISKLEKTANSKGFSLSELARRIKPIFPSQDKSMLSKYANGVCVPSNIALDIITNELQCSRLDLFDYEQLDLLGPLRLNSSVATAENKKLILNEERTIYKATFEMPKELSDILFKKYKYGVTAFLIEAAIKNAKEKGVDIAKECSEELKRVLEKKYFLEL